MHAKLRTLLAAVTVPLAVAAVSCPAAGAITPPELDPGAVPPSGADGPVQPMAQRSPCVATGVLPGTDLGAVEPESVDAQPLRRVEIQPRGRPTRGRARHRCSARTTPSERRPGRRLRRIDGRPGGLRWTRNVGGGPDRRATGRRQLLRSRAGRADTVDPFDIGAIRTTRRPVRIRRPRGSCSTSPRSQGRSCARPISALASSTSPP